MNVIVIPLDDTGQRHLMDRKALAQWCNLAEVTIRRRCVPVGVDPKTGSKLYPAEVCREQLQDVRQLPKLCSDGKRRSRRT